MVSRKVSSFTNIMGRKKLFVAQCRIEAPAEEVFQWHAEPGALERLTPPWEPLEVEKRAPGIRNGDSGVLRVRVGPFHLRWKFEHCDFIEGRQFRDLQLSGPFSLWDHTHIITPEGPTACMLTDRIEYELPFGFVGDFFGGWYVRKKLKKLFAYRHQVTCATLAATR